jgi:NADPH:quinone reductase-like Zn-dependent oxidoreductase
MRAVAVTEAGGYDVLEVIEREVSEPGPGEVRIAVAAAAVNPIDSAIRIHGNAEAGPAPWVPGMDAAGVIDAVGPQVDRLAAGQEVMAVVKARRPEGGAQAEQIVVPAAGVVPIPAGLTPAQASTLPMNGLTACLALDTLGLSAGQTLAVSGGAGLLASYAIAIAKADFGLRVIADASEEDENLVRSFGADEVVSRGDDFSAAVRELADGGVDGVLDTADLGDAALAAVRDGGTMVSVRGWKPEADVRRIRVIPIRVGAVLDRTDWLEVLARMATSGSLKLRPTTDYPPEQAGEAQRLMDEGGRRDRGVIVF